MLRLKTRHKNPSLLVYGLCKFHEPLERVKKSFVDVIFYFKIHYTKQQLVSLLSVLKTEIQKELTVCSLLECKRHVNHGRILIQVELEETEGTRSSDDPYIVLAKHVVCCHPLPVFLTSTNISDLLLNMTEA